MVYVTWAQGFKEANISTTASLKLETTLPHTLPNLSQRIFPSYVSSATLWSDLLASGLAPPSSGSQPFSSDTPATRQEAIKKWRMCLERADLVKKKVAAMGGQVGKAVGRGVGEASGQGDMSAKAGDPLDRLKSQRSKHDEAEQISILRRSSTIKRRSRHSSSNSHRHGAHPSEDNAKSLHLPLWHDADATFLTPLSSAQVEAMVVRPELSPDQRALHATWENIYNAANPFVDFAPCLSPSRTQGVTNSIKVEQGIGANCSVVAGLNVLVAQNARWGTALGLRNFVPIRIKDKGVNGNEASQVRYWRVKVFVNGAWRSLVIDSRLPVSSTTTQSLHCVLTPFGSDSQPSLESTSSLLWIPLLEKAYMTIIGSYAFPGSTPATDIHTLTSWIPERISSSGSQGFPRERTWSRITEGWNRRSLMITLGTGALVGRNGVSDARVVPLHAYAVVDVTQEDGGERRMRVMNPWKRGRTHMDDGRAWTRDLLESLAEEAEDEEGEEPSDIWWMSWDQVCNTFDTVNLNWDTSLFENTETVHGVYTGEDDSQPMSISVAAPTSGSDVWILLQRHQSTFASMTEVDDTQMKPSPQHKAIKMALQSLEDTCTGPGSRDIRLDDQGPLEYTTSTWILLQHICLMDKASLFIRPNFEIPDDIRGHDLAYTVTVYSDANIHVERRPTAYPYEQTLAVDFSGRSAGGHSGTPTYMYNPQYRIQFKHDPSSKSEASTASIRCSLKGEEKTSYNLKLVWSSGRRVTELEAQDVVADSGEYRYGQAAISKSITAGTYTLVASSFEPGKASQTSLKIDSTIPLTVLPIPQEGAGMFSRSLKGQWSGPTAAGRPSLGSYESNPRFELLVPEPASVFCRLQLASPASTSVPISIAVFRRGPSGLLKDQIATSGPYADTTSGVVTPDMHFDAGLYIIVPSTYAAKVEECFVLNVYATRKIELAPI